MEKISDFEYKIKVSIQVIQETYTNIWKNENKLKTIRPKNIFDRRNVSSLIYLAGTVYPQESEFPKEMLRKPLEMSGWCHLFSGQETK